MEEVNGRLKRQSLHNKGKVPRFQKRLALARMGLEPRQAFILLRLEMDDQSQRSSFLDSEKQSNR